MRTGGEIKVACPCGKIIRRDSVYEHFKSQKHQTFVKTCPPVVKPESLTKCKAKRTPPPLPKPSNTFSISFT